MTYTYFVEVLLTQIVHRIPAMETAEIRQMVNGPESFTPDGHYIMGEAPEVRFCQERRGKSM